MKYLVYLPAHARIRDRIQELRERVRPFTIHTSDNALHTTLYVLHTDEQHESEIARLLDRLVCPRAHCSTTDIDFFEPDALVLRLEKTPSLMGLHHRIINALSHIPKNTMPAPAHLGAESESIRQIYGSVFFGPNYNPHITIARVTSDIPLTRLSAPVIEWSATRFHLAKKTLDGWTDVETYSLD